MSSCSLFFSFDSVSEVVDAFAFALRVFFRFRPSLFFFRLRRCFRALCFGAPPLAPPTPSAPPAPATPPPRAVSNGDCVGCVISAYGSTHWYSLHSMYVTDGGRGTNTCEPQYVHLYIERERTYIRVCIEGFDFAYHLLASCCSTAASHGTRHRLESTLSRPSWGEEAM